MGKNTGAERLGQLGSESVLEEVIRRGARDLIQKAVEVELQELLAKYAKVRTLDGRRAVVRNGYLPSREVLTAVGNVPVRAPGLGEARSLQWALRLLVG